MRSVEIVLTVDERRFIGVRDPGGRWWNQMGPQSQMESPLEGDVLSVLTFEAPVDDSPDDLTDPSNLGDGADKPGQLA